MNPVTPEEVAAFLARCQAIVDAHTAQNFPNLVPDVLTCDLQAAKKYARVVALHRYRDDATGIVTTSTSGSAWCFIDLATGDILKPDGYKRPARHSRGNIRDEHQGVQFIGPYGPAYLR